MSKSVPLDRFSTAPTPNLFGSVKGLWEDLRRGHSPAAVMLTCSDLGWAPDEISGVAAGQFQVIQNCGGTLSGPGADDGTRASLCLTLLSPAIRHLVVCGHTDCRVRSARLEDHAPHRGKAATCHSSSLGRAQEATLRQTHQLAVLPPVQDRLLEGSLSLHAWVRDDHRARVVIYHPELGWMDSD